jgi:mono/diheme cytochrome c family protein
MPKQAEILTRRELRDLLAYLQTLGGEREIKRADDEAGHE